MAPVTSPHPAGPCDDTPVHNPCIQFGQLSNGGNGHSESDSSLAGLGVGVGVGVGGAVAGGLTAGIGGTPGSGLGITGRGGDVGDGNVVGGLYAGGATKSGIHTHRYVCPIAYPSPLDLHFLTRLPEAS